MEIESLARRARGGEEEPIQPAAPQPMHDGAAEPVATVGAAPPASAPGPGLLTATPSAPAQQATRRAAGRTWFGGRPAPRVQEPRARSEEEPARPAAPRQTHDDADPAAATGTIAPASAPRPSLAPATPPVPVQQATRRAARPPWWREAQLWWEDLWYGRWAKSLLLVALLLLVGFGMFRLQQQPRLATPPTAALPADVLADTGRTPTPAPTATPASAPVPQAPSAAAPAGVTIPQAPPAATPPGAPIPPAPAGTILFHSSQETPGFLQLFAMQPNGEGVRRIPGTPRNASHPRLSPDGTRVAFAGNEGGGDDLFVIGLDGSGLRRLTRGPGRNRFPVWSPDGKQLAFGSDRDGNWEIYTLGLDEGKLTRLTNNPADDNLPAWSPDGQWLAFQSDRGRGMHLYKMRADGGEVAAVTHGPGNDRYPVWSPDGRRLAYYSDREGGRDQLFAIDADGGHDTRLTTSAGRDQLPAWSPEKAGGSSSPRNARAAGAFISSSSKMAPSGS